MAARAAAPASASSRAAGIPWSRIRQSDDDWSAVMTKAEELFNEAFLRYQKLWATIYGFRQALMGVLEAVARQQRERAEETWTALVSDPYYKRILIDPEKFAKSVDREKFADQVGEGTTKQAKDSLDAAIVVFAHSVLDGAAMDYCRVTAAAAPKDWEPELQGRRVPLLEIANANYNEIFQRKLEDRLQELERESLVTKIDRLLARCQPAAKWSPMTGYEFDMETIKQLDFQRHEIIHGLAVGIPLKHYAVSDESLFYLARTSMYFQGLVNLKYGLRLDPSYLSYLWESRLPPSAKV